MEYGRYYSAAADDFVDISGGYSEKSSGRYSGSYGSGDDGGNNNKNKIIIIASVAAAVVIAAVVVFCIVMLNSGSSGSGSGSSEAGTSTFVFADNTKVSGLDISGKTPKEAKTFLEQNKKTFIKPVKFSVEIGSETVELTQSDFDYTYNIDEVIAQVEADANTNNSTSGKNYEVKATPTEKSITDKSVAVCEEHYTDAKNAYVSKFHPYEDNRFEIEEAKNGLCVDKDDLKKQINTAFKSGKSEYSIKAYTEKIKPEVSADFLKKNLVKLSSYETYSSNTENGTNNMKVSLAACNGSIIDPGEIWSFNDCTGDSNLASNGYLPANVIVDGKIEQGNGGGICQSSSTIYNAAIRANLDIVERAPHEWASLYVPTGLDATIDYPNLDLKLENPSKYQVFLECKLVNYTLYVSFWGVQDSSYDEIRTRNELGETSGSKYSVKAWRVYFKDGKKIKEEELPSSYYDLKNGQVFYPADNDAGAVETNVDNLNDSVSINTQTYDSGQSGGTDTQITYTEPATEAAVQTDAQAQTEAQSSTSQAADSA